MAGLLDFLGFGDGLTLPDQAGQEAGVGVLDRPTLLRMMKMANPTGQVFNTKPGLPPSPPSNPLGAAAGVNDIVVPPSSPPARPPQMDPRLPITQGQGLPAGASPFPTAPPPAGPVVPQASAGLLSGGAEPGATPVTTQPSTFNALDQPQQPAPPPQKPLSPGAQRAVAEAPATEGVLNRVMGFLNKNSDTFLGLAAGFGGAPSISQGLGRAATGAMYGGQQDYARQGTNLTAQVLQAKGGYSPQEAEAIARNPELLKQVINKIYPQPTFKTITDSAGNQRLVVTNDAAGTVANPNVVPSGAPQVRKIEEAFSLPRGTVFVDPSGNLRRVP